jgi:hypothetical protein
LSLGEVLESVLALARDGLKNPRLFLLFVLVFCFCLRRLLLGEVLVSKRGSCF